MRRILLTSQAEQYASDYLSKLKAGNKYKSSYLKPQDRIKELIPSFRGDYKKYLKKIYEEFDDLVLLKPSQFEQKIVEFNAFETIDLNRRFKVQGYKDKHSFCYYVENALQYTLIRTYVFPCYVKLLGIKTCVYCNSNYTVTDHHGVAYYDLDHYKPKSKYPYLSISFFNLQPSCPVCNRIKNDDSTELYMNLWEENSLVDRDVFRFSISKKDRIKYWITHDRHSILIRLLSADKKYDSMRNYTDKHLHISARYNEHADVAEEMLWKRKAYTKDTIDALTQSLKGLCLSSIEMERFMMGTYMNKDDVYKRPLTKMMQDIYNEE